jgi:hypothetical protein
MTQSGPRVRTDSSVCTQQRRQKEEAQLKRDIDPFVHPPSRLVAFFQPRGLWCEGSTPETAFNGRHLTEIREARLGELRHLQHAAAMSAPVQPTEEEEKKIAALQQQAEITLHLFFVAFLADFFEDYRTRRFRAFLSFELLVATLIAGIDGYAIATQHCASMAIVLLVVLVVHFLVILIVRPHDVSGNNLFFVLLTLVQVILGILAVIATHSTLAPTAQVSTMLTIVTILQYVFLLKALWDVGSLGYTTSENRAADVVVAIPGS